MVASGGGEVRTSTTDVLGTIVRWMAELCSAHAHAHAHGRHWHWRGATARQISQKEQNSSVRRQPARWFLFPPKQCVEFNVPSLLMNISAPSVHEQSHDNNMCHLVYCRPFISCYTLVIRRPVHMNFCTTILPR